jgi:hypothetical protein
VFSGESECSSEQPGFVDLSDADGEVIDGQSNIIFRKICKSF